ncbi:MAG: helix-turn-helix transcriptional regulator [Hyphomicrobiales bacterium]|nr:helix-turn-helix transcriptional regulator [Hyphomicrobiales bacterium]
MEENGGAGVRMADIAKAARLSRQAVYLHFPTRAELLIETTRYVDEVLGVEERLEAFHAAATAPEKLDAFIAFMASHWPQVAGVATALIDMRDTDAAAAEAWADRTNAVKEGCRIVILALDAERRLVGEWSVEAATDMLWAMLSFENWDQLTAGCGWTPDQYVNCLQLAARLAFVKG